MNCENKKNMLMAVLNMVRVYHFIQIYHNIYIFD